MHSRSAIGEQFLDLIPPVTAGCVGERAESSAERWHDVFGQRIGDPSSRTSVPQDIAPLLDDLDATLAGVPNDKLGDLLTQSADAFGGGNGENMSRLLDAFHAFTADAKANLVPTKKLITDLVPVLQSQQVSSDAIRRWALESRPAHRPADRPQRCFGPGDHRTGPRAMGQANALFQQFRPTLPLLLANLVSLGEVGVTYNPSLEQILVAIPRASPSWRRSPCPTWAVPTAVPPVQHQHAELGSAVHDRVLAGVGPPATGLPSIRRPVPRATCTARCRQNTQVAVRGARNLPCMMKPGKRAPP